jgi:hypothetical protein
MKDYLFYHLILQYTSDSRTSGFQMFYFSDTFKSLAIEWSGYQMVGYTIFVRTFLASLDHFGMNKIFLMTLISKTV